MRPEEVKPACCLACGAYFRLEQMETATNTAPDLGTVQGVFRAYL